MNIKQLAAIVPLALALSACGDTWGQRAVTGGALGVGAGAAVAWAAGFPIIGSAVIGGLLGAGAGAAMTSEKGGMASFSGK